MTTPMAEPDRARDGIVVEDEVSFTLTELCRACRTCELQVFALVDEGVLTPQGHASAEWVFAGSSLRTARTALRLVDDFELNPAGVALVLELLAQVDALRARLRRADLL